MFKFRKPHACGTSSDNGAFPHETAKPHTSPHRECVRLFLSFPVSPIAFLEFYDYLCCVSNEKHSTIHIWQRKTGMASISLLE